MYDIPIFIGKIDENTGKLLKAYYFLGDVPNEVLRAANKCKLSDATSYTWTPEDSKILASFYGPDWKTLLSPSDPPDVNYYSTLKPKKGGGSDVNLGDLDSFSKSITLASKSKHSYQLDKKQSSPLYTSMSLFDEDSLFEVRNKLYIAASVPPYRQHLFFYVDDEGPIETYSLTVDGFKEKTDWKEIKNASTLSGQILISGITVDSELEKNKNKIFIKSIEDLYSIKVNALRRINKLYFVDLYSVIPPGSLRSELLDSYKCDLLYYGYVIKFWPQLNLEAFIYAITSPEDMTDKFPNLCPDFAKTQKKIEKESELIQNIRRTSISQDIDVSITTAQLITQPQNKRMKLDLRNITDFVTTSPQLVAIYAKCAIETEYSNKYLIIKKQSSASYLPEHAIYISKLLSRPIEKNKVRFFTPFGKRGHYIISSIDIRGKCVVETEWEEDDEMHFDEIIEDIKKYTDPIIKQINSMGSASMPFGGKLESPSVSNSSFENISLSIFWPVYMSSTDFKEMRTFLKDYQDCGIIAIKNLQQIGSLSFTFLKGIINYEMRAIDKIFDKIGNYYAHLTDDTISYKWNSLLSGRQVKLYHRITDIKIEIININNIQEYYLISKYIFAILNDFTKTISSPKKAEPTATSNRFHHTTSANAMLKHLQETDPDLFDLKKYNPKSVVYSRICQSKDQPAIFSEHDYKQMPVDKKKHLVKYWNFTKNEPAYYSCPNKKRSPYFSFKIDSHPMGYCLPCCRQTKPTPNSKAEKVFDKCMRDYIFNSDSTANIDDASTRHILMYGKEIEPGRIAYLPAEFTDGLFVNAFPFPYKMYLYGVEQTVPSVPNAGFAFALAYALSAENEPCENVIADIAKYAVENISDTFYSLSGSTFSTAQDLCDALLDTFVYKKPTLSPFGPGGIMKETWHDLLVELARLKYAIEVVIIREENGRIIIEANPEIVASIMSPESLSSELIIIFSSSFGTYPIVTINSRLYNKATADEKWQLIRKTYDLYPNMQDMEEIHDNVGEIVRDVFLKVSTNHSVMLPDLNLLLKYALHPSSKYKIKNRLINMRNYCFGLAMSPSLSADRMFYFPIIPSVYTIEGIDLLFGRRIDVLPSKQELTDLISDINNFIKESNETSYIPISPTMNIVNKNRYIIGFIARNGISQSIYYYHDEINEKDMNAIIFPYSTYEIDGSIIDTIKGISSKNARVVKLTEEGEKKNNLYRLFCAEFLSHIKKYKNTEIREKIKQILQTYDKTVISSFKQVLIKLKDLVEIQDWELLRDILSSDSVYEQFDETIFLFDRQILTTFRELKDPRLVIVELKKLMENSITIGTTSKASGNIYVSCSESSVIPKPQCIRNKLEIPPDLVDIFYDILAQDILNPYSQIEHMSSTAFNPLEFIKRSGEHIEIAIENA